MKSTWFFLVIEFSWGVIITSFFGRKKGCVVNFYSFVPVFFVLVHYRASPWQEFLSCPKIKGSTYTVSYHTQPSSYLLNIWNNMKIWPFCVKSLIFEKLGCTMLQKLSKCEVMLDFVEIWSLYFHSDFAWNQILTNSNGPKMSFLNFEFWQILD